MSDLQEKFWPEFESSLCTRRLCVEVVFIANLIQRTNTIPSPRVQHRVLRRIYVEITLPFDPDACSFP